ncbi:hypothetical protein EUZ85_17780 [Hahella sp. KA22]|uniref:imm11 family protein n=1 Tax=Hahella sp. KA22 TaxID=1628392 RepID=UPI000FDCF4F1|nr:DUF1629 domain-containing protein [Hahella sp. KA22]AZZ92470.1 hypothetical protein ENC22_15205 [Hahella sp. KA22]QAY55844.1 hypothetical protein EUZ85_17780 [Hahella sp. KA22]
MTSYFHFGSTGDLNNSRLCLIEDAPKDMGKYSFTLTTGMPATPYFPQDAKVYLREENPGAKLEDIVGNTRGCFIASSKVEAIVREFAPEGVEFLPFTLINHKNKVHSKDLRFINPLQIFDCLDYDAAEVELDDDGAIEYFEELILCRAKLEHAPHIFRIAGSKTDIVFSEALTNALKAAETTNLLLDELEIV